MLDMVQAQFPGGVVAPPSSRASAWRMAICPVASLELNISVTASTVSFVFDCNIISTTPARKPGRRLPMAASSRVPGGAPSRFSAASALLHHETVRVLQ